jgi:hypothetical protein
MYYYLLNGVCIMFIYVLLIAANIYVRSMNRWFRYFSSVRLLWFSSDTVAMDTTGEMNVEQGGGSSFAPVEESSSLLPSDGGVLLAASSSVSSSSASSVSVAVIHMEEEAMQISSSDDVIPTDSIAVYEEQSIPMSINPSEVR